MIFFREEESSFYSAISFSADGALMCLQGSSPRFLISVWNWRNNEQIACSEGDPYPVYSLLFSPFNPTLITTCGQGHINFWRIVTTSSGTKIDKLAGKLCRKPKTDIEACIQLSDGKVISGCTWGSLLLWEKGAVKVEIKRRDLSKCHQSSVLQFVIAEGELISIGADSWVRVWDLESIQHAEGINLEKTDGVFLLDPINEVQIAPDAVLQSISKSKVRSSGEEHFWYIQDAGGGIWKADLSFSLTMRKPEKIFQCHAGAVTSLVSNPSENILISGGIDGRICAYNLKRNTMVGSIKYTCGVTCMHWLPLALDITGTQVLIGFEDGVVRLYFIMVNMADGNFANVIKAMTVNMRLLQALKPHRKAVRKIKAHLKINIAASVGNDNTIFVFRLNSQDCLIKVIPIGYFSFDQQIIAVDFHPGNSIILMVGLEDGNLKFLDLNGLPNSQDEKVCLDMSQFLQDEIDIKTYFGKTEISLFDVWYEKTELIQCTVKTKEGIELYSINKRTEIEELRVMENVKIVTPTSTSDLSVIVPPVRNSTIICGFSNGFLKVEEISSSKKNNYWLQSISDYKHGIISDILVMDGKIITSGLDGTVFVFGTKDEILSKNKNTSAEMLLLLRSSYNAKALNSSSFENVHDIEDPNHLCIEDMKMKVKEEQDAKDAEEKMLKIQKDVSNLKRDFKKLLTRNEALPREFKIPKENFQMTDYTFQEIQNTICKDIEKMTESFKGETDKAVTLLNSLKATYFDPVVFSRICVKGLRSKQELSTFRLARLDDSDLYDEEYEEVDLDNYHQETYTPKTPKLADGTFKRSTGTDTVDSESNISSSATNISKSKLNVKISNGRILKALNKQEDKREKKLLRKREWDDLYNRKPRENDEDPTLVEEFKHAKENMGDFKRKTSFEYKQKEDLKPDKISKDLNVIVKMIFSKKKDFNEKVVSLQKEKLSVIAELKHLYKEIIKIQEDLKPCDRDNIPNIPTLDSEEHNTDIFTIEQTEVENLKIKLASEEEEMELGKKNIGSRRGSKASSIGLKRAPRQLSSASRQSSVAGQLGLSKPEKKNMFSHTGYGHTTLEEDESDQCLQDFTITEKSQFEIMIESREIILAKHKQKQKINEMNKKMSDFDDKIFEAVCQKNDLEAQLKYAELSLILLFEKFQIINKDQELEACLKAEVEKHLSGLEKVNTKLESVELQLKNKQRNVEIFREQKRSIDENVERELSDNKYADYLWDLYNKKPSISHIEDCYADIDLEMGFTDTLLTAFQTEECISNDDEINLKPEDIDQETFKLIIGFRNKKHDAEAGLTAERRLEDNIGRELTNLRTISSTKEKALHDAQYALHVYMIKRQQKLNELDQVVMVNMHNLRFLDCDRLHGTKPSADELLAFPENLLITLQERTEELKYEKNIMKKKYKETKNAYEGLISSNKQLKKEIQVLDLKCNVEMEKRFGPGVTLERLESFSVNRTLEEMKETLLLKEREYWKIQDKKEEDIKAAKLALHEQIIINTDILTSITSLQRQKFSNMKKKEKWEKLIKENLEKQEIDKANVEELKEMVKKYQRQEAHIKELKELLMRYLLKSGVVETTKKNWSRPMTGRLQQEPARIKNLQVDFPVVQIQELSKRGIPTINLKM